MEKKRTQVFSNLIAFLNLYTYNMIYLCGLFVERKKSKSLLEKKNNLRMSLKLRGKIKPKNWR